MKRLQLAVNLPPQDEDLLNWLREESRRRRVSISWLVRDFIRQAREGSAIKVATAYEAGGENA